MGQGVETGDEDGVVYWVLFSSCVLHLGYESLEREIDLEVRSFRSTESP